MFCFSDSQRDVLLNSMAQVIISQISDRLSQIVVSEIQRTMLPLIAGKLDAIKTQIHSEVVQKLTVCDQLMKENISKMCTSKVT